MTMRKYTGCAIAFGIALMLSAATDAGAQTRTTSEKRIPVSKDQGVRRESNGDVVISAEIARVDALEATAAALRQRLDALEAANATLTSLASRTDANERMISTLTDSLRLVRSEITSVRSQLAEANARTAALGDSLYRLNQRVAKMGHGSLFGHSGFYVGAGTGANFTSSTLKSNGYEEGLNVTFPIGWSKPGTLLGVRAELGAQTFDGRNVAGFSNPDPRILSAIGMVTLNLPFNSAKTNSFYLMGGGGSYMFKDIYPGSALNTRFGNVASNNSVTKWGINAGAGLDLHVLGATSLFVQTSYTSVSANGSIRWIPVTAGVTLR